MLKVLALVLFIGAANLFATAWSQVTPAVDCPSDPSLCTLPNCRCFSTNPPGNVTKPNTPQIVYLTFDDAINSVNYQLYEEILFERTNPNGAAISATFFISHEYTDYKKTHELYRHGHEIALHSITHQVDPTYWASLNESMWVKEIADQRALVAKFAEIPESEIKGMRAPFLQIGGDAMYKALYENNFQYECSRSSWQFRPRLWPYTADYKSDQDCVVGPCHVGSYPGFWTVPMISFLGGNLFPCAMVDTCLPVVNTTQETYNLLKVNFDDHYEGQGNKAPYGIFTHSAWITDPERKAGYIQFLDYLKTKPDVFIVSISKALDWIKNPVPLANISQIPSWQPKPIAEDLCPRFVNCRFTVGGYDRWMTCCRYCPARYPWLDNPLGNP